MVFSDIESEAFMSRLSSYSVFTKMLTVICAKSRFPPDSNEAATSKNWIYSSVYPYTYIHSSFICVLTVIKRIQVAAGFAPLTLPKQILFWGSNIIKPSTRKNEKSTSKSLLKCFFQ